MALRLKNVGLRVLDMDESLRFYTEVLGMEVVHPLASTPPTRGKVVVLRSPGSTQLLELNWYEPGSRFGPPYLNGEDLDHLAYECEDVGRTVAELESRGVEILLRPREAGDPDAAFVQDPNGIWIELVPRAAPTPSGT